MQQISISDLFFETNCVWSQLYWKFSTTNQTENFNVVFRLIYVHTSAPKLKNIWDKGYVIINYATLSNGHELPAVRCHLLSTYMHS